MTKGDAIITTGVGQHQMWAAQYYNFTKPAPFLTSAGLGAMGFGYPAAMGAKIAFPDKQVIDIGGDGSFLMNVQELATCHIEGIAAKVIILNNQHLGMVVQWEDRFYKSNRGHTFLGDPKDLKRIYPDYVEMCQGLRREVRARDPQERPPCGHPAHAGLQGDLRPRRHDSLHRARSSDDPAGKTYKDIITE